jgi:fibronectin type 3 domain-containing protein
MSEPDRSGADTPAAAKRTNLRSRRLTRRSAYGLAVALVIVVLAGTLARAANEVQKITLSGVTASQVSVSDGQGTVTFSTGATAAQVQTSLEGLPSVGTGNVSVTGSSTTPGTVDATDNGNGTASASSAATTEPASGAFDNNTGTDWRAANQGKPQWLQWDFGANNAQTISSYRIYGIASVGDARTWTILGSNTGAFSGEQTTLDSRSGITMVAGWNSYTIASPTSFRYYRFNVTATGGSGQAPAGAWELELLHAVTGDGSYNITFQGAKANLNLSQLTTTTSGASVSTLSDGFAAPGTLSVSNLSQTSLTLTLPSLPSGATSFSVQQKLTSDADTSYTDIATNLSGGTSTNVTGLTANTAFSFRAVAINSGGSTPGSAVACTTLPNPPDAPAAPSPQNITTSSAQITAPASLPARATSLRAELRQPGGAWSTVQSGVAASVTVTLSSLDANTAYETRWVAVGDGGETTGSAASFTTQAVKIWSADSAISGTINPLAPSWQPTVKAPGGLLLFTATASDSDHWILGDQFGDTADTNLTYAWSATDANGNPAGSFDSTTASMVTFSVPQTPGLYAVTCAVNDTATPGAGEQGTRHDATFNQTSYVVVPQKSWSIGGAISNAAGSQPQMTAPAEPHGPGSAVVPTNASVACELEEAHDSDHWVQADTSGDEDDVVLYSWTATDANGTAAGSFPSGSNTRSATWIAPATPGTYTLTGTIDDLAPVGVDDIDSRDDAPVVQTRQITVAQIGGLKYADATAQTRTYQDVPAAGLVVPIGSQLSFKALPTPSGHCWPAGQPLWDGSFGALGGGTTSTTINFSTAGEYTITATFGNGLTGGDATGNVLEAHVTVVSAALSPESVHLKRGTLTSLTTAVEPSTAVDQVQWVVADPTIASLTVIPVEGAAPQLSLQGDSLGTTVVQAKLGTGTNAPVLATVQVWVNQYGLDSNEVIVQPDGQIRTSSDQLYTGEHLLDPQVAARQTVSQTATPGSTAVYQLNIVNDNLSEISGVGADTLNVTGPGDSDGWSVKYYDALTGGTDITGQVTGTGWSTGSLQEGAGRSLRVEVTPASDLASATPLQVAVTTTTGFASVEKDVVAAVTQPLLPPATTSATADEQRQVTVQWSASAGASQYRLYEATSEQGTYQVVTDVTGTSYVRTDRLNDTDYFYKVTALDAVGHETTTSTAATAHTPALGVPQDLTATAGDKQIALAWTGVAHAQNYRIFLLRSDGAYFVAGTTDDDTPAYTVTGLVNGLTYTYFVRAVNLGGESASSDSATAVPTGTPPDQPTNLTVLGTGHDRAIALQWDASAGALLYRVYRGTTANGDFEPVYVQAAGTGHQSYTDSNLQNGTTYYYQVTAVDGAQPQPGESAPSATVQATTDTLAAPTGPVAHNGINHIDLSWNTVDKAERYIVYRGTTTGAHPDVMAEVTAGSYPGTQQYSDTSAPQDAPYYYVVQAWNSGGASADSNETSATSHPGVDAMIRTASATDYIGDTIYNSDGAGQSVAQNTGVGVGATYRVKVQNIGGAAAQLLVKAPASPTGWTAQYYKGLSTAAADEITADVTTAGWQTDELDASATQEVTVVVTPDGTVANAATCDTLVTASVVGSTFKADTVKATTTRVRQVGSLQYSTDGGTTWTSVAANGNVRLPVNTQAQFKAVPNPDTEQWQDGQPVWSGTAPNIANGGVSPSVTFNTVGDYTVQATCDNSLTANVHVVGITRIEYKRASDTTWQEFGTDPLVITQGDSLSFHAVSNPENAVWPDNKPVWGGTGPVSGTGETIDPTAFNTPGDLTVTATCGNTVTAAITTLTKVEIGIRNADETTYSSHTAHNAVPVEEPATYYAHLSNANAVAETLNVTAPVAATHWTVSYFDDDLPAANADVTSAITGTGLGVTLQPAAEKVLRIVVAPDLDVTPDDSTTLAMAAVLTADTRCTGSVNAATTRIKVLDKLMFRTNVANAWADAPGTDQLPLMVYEGDVVNYLAQRRNEDWQWPLLKPTWDHGGTQLLGDNIAGSFAAPSQSSTDLKNIQVAYGDAVATKVLVYPRWDVAVEASREDEYSTSAQVTVTVTGALGAPVPSASVRLSATYDDGSAAGTFSGGGIVNGVVTTGTSGTAVVTWTKAAPTGYVHFQGAALVPAGLTVSQNGQSNAGTVIATSATTHMFTSNPAPSATSTPAPPAPSALNLSGTTTDTTAVLTWTLNEDLDFMNYELIRSTTANFTSGTVSTIYSSLWQNINTYTDYDLAPSTTYYYKATATNRWGITTTSTVLSVTTLATPTTPSAPTAVTLSLGTPVTALTVPLSWTATDDDDNFLSYELHRASDTNFTDDHLIASYDDSTVLQENDGTVLPNHTYYYKLVVTDIYDQSTDSNVVDVTTPAAATPTINPPAAVALTAGTPVLSCRVPLSWTLDTDTANFHLYELRRATNANFTNDTVVDFFDDVTVGSDTDTTVAPSTTYYYKLVVYDIYGQATGSAAESVTTPATPNPPAASTLTLGTPVTGGSVPLSWTTDTDTDYFDHYELHRATDINFTDDELVQAYFSADEVAGDDMTVQPSTGYYYKLVVYDICGQSTASTPLAVTTPAWPTPTPVTLSLGTPVTMTSVPLTWTAFTDAPNFGYYELHRATDANFTDDGIVGSIFDIAQLTTADPSVMPNNTYYYKLVVHDSHGQSADSNVINVTTPAAPAPPVVTLSIGNPVNPTSVPLTWTPDTDTPSFSYYELHRATDAGFSDDLIINVFGDASTVAAADETAQPNTTYYYKLVVYDIYDQFTTSAAVSTTTPVGP